MLLESSIMLLNNIYSIDPTQDDCHLQSSHFHSTGHWLVTGMPWTFAQCSKTFYGRNLRFVISPWEAFPLWPNVCG